MIGVSDAFKTAIKKGGRTVKAYILYDGNYITESDNLQTMKISSTGDLCKSIMRQAECTYSGTTDLKDKYVNLGYGTVLADTTTEYADFGSFKVISDETNQGFTTHDIILYDKMYEAQQMWALEPIYDIVYPCTLSDLVQAICDKLAWTFDVTTFPNSTLSIPSDLFTGLQLTYRDVLDQIAEASGSIIYFGTNDHLKIRQVLGTILETLIADNIISLKVESLYGAISSVVLSREPQEDNIAQISA